MNKSLNTIMITIQSGGLRIKVFENVIPKKAESSNNLSAKGSKKVPNSVRFLKVLAIKPSNASVAMAMIKRMSAIGLKCS